MNARMMMIAKLAVLVALFGLANLAEGQPDTLKCRKEAFSLDSGIHDGSKNSLNSPTRAFRGTVQIANAPWVKIYFGNCELGQSSYIKMTSLEDGGYQNLNAVSLKQWQNTSAFFNGDAVEVELYVDPDDKGCSFEVVEVVVGERLSNSSGLGKNRRQNLITSDPCNGPCGICGSTDDRVPSSDPAIGRISGIFTSGDTGTVCTGWIASNGAYITAGHCFRSDTPPNKFFEFNVPASDSDGTPNFAHPDHQYPLDATSVVSEDALWGRDWAVYRCFPNSNTGLLPVQAQNAFYRLTLDSSPTTFRLTGFGVDECPAGTGPTQRNSSSNTQQTGTGPNYGESGSGNFVYWSYCIDHRNGNSGGPVIPDGTGLSVGIVTYCSPVAACSFDCDPLENAVNIYPGANIRYADNGHPFASGSGTVFRPYNTVTGAVAAVPTGGLVSIVQGSYNESMTISTAMTIIAPVGTVTIGPVPLPKLVENNLDPGAIDRQKKSKLNEFRLSQNYPNPFNPETTIEYELAKRSHVKLVIYDLLGQEIRVLVNELKPSGNNSVVWDGKNNHGQLVPSGFYVYRLTADKFTQTSKSILLR